MHTPSAAWHNYNLPQKFTKAKRTTLQLYKPSVNYNLLWTDENHLTVLLLHWLAWSEGRQAAAWQLVLFYIYIPQLNRVNHQNDFIIITAP